MRCSRSSCRSCESTVEGGARRARSSLVGILGVVLVVASAFSVSGCAGTEVPEARSTVATRPTESEPLPPPLPGRRYAHGTARLDDGWVVLGGNARGTDDGARSVLLWDPAQPEAGWRDAPPLAARHTFTGTAVDDGVVFAVGEGVQRRDPTTGAWSVIVADARLPRSHAFATACDGKVYVAGGFPEERGHVQVVDLATGTVTDGPPMPGYDRGDHFILLATLAGKVHALGGLDADCSTPQQEHFRLDGDTWVACAPHPTGVMGKFTAWCAYRDRLYVFEGKGFVYDPTDDTWTPLADPPPMRVLPSLTGVGERLVMLGGLEPEHGRNEAWVYRIDEDRWERVDGSGE